MNKTAVVVVFAGFAGMIYWFVCVMSIYSFLTKRLFRKHPHFRKFFYQGLKPDWAFANINRHDFLVYLKFQVQFAICGLVAAVPMFFVILAVIAWFSEN